MILKPFKVHSPDGKTFYEGECATPPTEAAPAASAGPIERFMLDANINGVNQMREFVLASDHDQRVHDLETLCDPAGLVAENALLRDQTKMLDAMVGRLKLELAARSSSPVDASKTIPAIPVAWYRDTAPQAGASSVGVIVSGDYDWKIEP